MAPFLKELMKKQPEKRLKIVVGTNALTEIQWPSYSNHCQFWFRLGRSYSNIDFILSNPPRMSIDRMRNMTAKVALETNSDYVLFLDDDVLVNPISGLKMLLDCEADIAAGRVCVRGWPFNYMVFKSDGNDGLIIQNKIPRHGIHSCDAVGFSFALIKTDLIRKVPEPFFVTGLNHTEDVYFCYKCRVVDRKCSIKVNCDCDCGHILWPEVLDERNRKAFMKYLKEINPNLIPANYTEGADRGSKYLKMVKKATK